MNKVLPLTILILLIGLTGCKDQLDVVNPNQPTPQSAKNEQGILAFASGALYINGDMNTLFGTIMRRHELMGDIVGSPEFPAELYCPDNIIFDNGTNLVSIHPEGQRDYLKTTNIPSAKTNSLYWEWKTMYFLNNAMNMVLENVDPIAMADSKKNTIKVWAWFWKGYAYSRIGSMYHAGIINDEANKTNGKYVTRKEILAEAELNFSKAAAMLQTLSGDKEYYPSVMNSLIPSICKVDKGKPPSVDQWLRHINTLRARNILVNTSSATMTNAQWDSVAMFTQNGIEEADNVFTVRTDGGNLLSARNYTSAQAIGPAVQGGGTAKVSERLIQEFRPGDKRLSNNFRQIPTWIVPGDRGTATSTRYALIDKGIGNGAVIMVNLLVGSHELYIAGSYQENVLMQAEAYINKGNIEDGLVLIDELRKYQGAGLASVAGTGLTLVQAKEELRRERRVALAFRGFSFYDARRWGVLKNGRTGCVVIDSNGKVNTNATIQYGYMEYWDVPIAESLYNKPSENSAPITNPD